MFEKNSVSNDFSFTLTMRQLSFAVAGLLAFSFFIFISGYFLGQKRAAQDFVYRADQDSLADQIYSSMCVLYDSKEDEESENNVEENESATEVPEAESPIELAESTDSKEADMQEIISEVITPQKKHRAIIAGYPKSQLAKAKQQVAHLINKGYAADLIEHVSTHKKISKKWYQLIVQDVSKEYLEKMRSKLAKMCCVKEQSIEIK